MQGTKACSLKQGCVRAPRSSRQGARAMQLAARRGRAAPSRQCAPALRTRRVGIAHTLVHYEARGT